MLRASGREAALSTVGIDARKIRDFGIGRYLEGLLGALASAPGAERYVLFLQDPDRDSLPGSLPSRLDSERFRLVACDAGLYSAAELLAFRNAPRRFDLDLLHFPHYVRPLVHGAPVSVMVHDTIHLSHPPSSAARLYAEIMLRRALGASLVLTGTNAARADLAARLGARPDRITVVPHGIDRAFSPPDPEAVGAFRRARDLAGNFVLMPASHRPHKNLAGGIAAWRQAGEPGGALVIPARDAETGRRLQQASGEAPVRILEGVSDEDLPRLYAAARVVLVPSLAEGFGLPPLEAAGCGAPVVAFGIPPHVEVLGEGAELVPGEGADALASALARVWRDDDRRAELSRLGPERARSYPWSLCAERTLTAWRTVLPGR